MSTPIITSPVFPQGSLKEKIHYHTSCYLTLGEVTCNSIANSTTYNGRTYHLLNAYHLTSSNAIFTWIGTTIKVISYCTIVIPIIALLLHKSTQTHGVYFAKESSYNYFSLKDLHKKSPEHLAILHRFVPDLFQTSLVKDACTNENIPFLKSVAEHSPNRLAETFTSFNDMPRVLDTILLSSEHESLHPLLNPVYLTKAAQWYHKPDLEKLLNNNPSLWRSLVATKSPKDYCSFYNNTILISQVYAELTRCAAENKTPPALHPDIFSTEAYASYQRTTILALAFSHNNTQLFSYLLTHYKESVLTKQSLEGCLEWLHRGSNMNCPLKDCNKNLDYSGSRTLSQERMLESLVPYASAEIANLFSDTIIASLKASNHRLAPFVKEIIDLTDKRDEAKVSCYPAMSMLFELDKNKWANIVQTKDPKEYCAPQYQKELFQQVYHTLWTSYKEKKENPIQFHPNIFSLKSSDSDNKTIFEVIFTHNEKEFFSYLLEHYKPHMLSDFNLKAFVNILQKKPPTSTCEYYTPYDTRQHFLHFDATRISLAQKEMFKSLLTAQGESLYNYFSTKTMQNINSINERKDLINYLHSSENPYRLPDNLRLFIYPQTNPTSSFPSPSTSDSERVYSSYSHSANGVSFTCSSSSSSEEAMKFFENLFAQASFNNRADSESQLTAFISNLQKIIKKQTPNDPIEERNICSKEELNNLYLQAMRIIHPDKCKSKDPKVIENHTKVTQQITEAYNTIKNTEEYATLPDQ